MKKSSLEAQKIACELFKKYDSQAILAASKEPIDHSMLQEAWNGYLDDLEKHGIEFTQSGYDFKQGVKNG